jgi:FkbM family methyltransferase
MSLGRSLVRRLSRTPLIDHLVYRTRYGPARGLKRQGGLGWLPPFIPRSHEWDAEEAFLTGLDWRGLTIYDVGGDQGLFTLFFAHRAGGGGKVVVFEPNPQSCARIQRNVELNDFHNVRIMPVGLGNRHEKLTFTYPPFEPARGTANHTIARQIEQEAGARVCEIEVSRLDDEIARRGLPAPQFIKLDVEGMEYDALLGMQETLLKHRPRLSIEIHGATMEEKILNAERVVNRLDAWGYDMLHIESNTVVNSQNPECTCEGHLYCETRVVH